VSLVGELALTFTLILREFEVEYAGDGHPKLKLLVDPWKSRPGAIPIEKEHP
jgi:hypothetical protein